MNEESVVSYITETFPEVQIATNYGYTFFFYSTDHKFPFATLAAADNEHDRVSHLDRPGVFRLNIGVSKPTFQDLLGTKSVDLEAYDFTALDVFLPHPHYAAHHFLCVLSPSEITFQKVQALLAEAYEIARRRFAKNAVSEHGPEER